MEPHPLARAFPAALIIAGLLVGAPAAVMAADPQAPPARPASSPVVVERVENTAIFAPDFKYTDIDRTDGFLLGAYGGVLVDKALFLGGGGYWMVNGDDLHGLGYGGAILAWHPVRSRQASVSLGGLVGFGMARVSSYDAGYGYGVPEPQVRFGHGSRMYPPGGAAYPHSGYWYWDQGFMVVEPQVTVVFQIADGASIAASAGYRFALAANGFEDQISGLTAGVSIRFGSTK